MSPPMQTAACDVLVIGAGAAGLATAIFTARHNRGLRIVALDGAKKLGAKILVAGGGRCNVTNVRVTPADYCGGSRNSIGNVLKALTVEHTEAFFADLGVPLHQEQWGKLFPDTNDARTVLAALLGEATRLGVQLRPGQRVVEVRRTDAGAFVTRTANGEEWTATRVVLSTGGLALPKSGSDGGGYELARMLGHSLVPTTPALAPLVLEGDFHAPLSGVSHEAELAVRVEGEKQLRLRGPLLWTHFGVSGPAAMNASRHWLRARLEGRSVSVTMSFLPDVTFETAEERLSDLARSQPRSTLRGALATMLPARVADALAARLSIPPQMTMSQLPRDVRRRTLHALLEWPLPVRDSRGYTYAEATAGGVPLTEIDTRTMESRVQPGLYLVGEILDVDGRIGGFNFQWAWSSGFVAGGAIAAAGGG